MQKVVDVLALYDKGLQRLGRQRMIVSFQPAKGLSP